MSNVRSVSLAGLCLSCALATPLLDAQTTYCAPIVSLPTTLSAAGVYCLTADFVLHLASGAAIEVSASNVVIDLNDHSVRNSPPAGTISTAIGIHALGRHYLTVKNGALSGFDIGVSIEPGSDGVATKGHLVDGVRVSSSRSTGISLIGNGSSVTHCRVIDSGPSAADVAGMGILLQGQGLRAVDNDVMEIHHAGVFDGRAIVVYLSQHALVVGNRITDAESGVLFFPDVPGIGRYRDNLTSGVNAPFGGGVDAGGNNSY